MNRTAEQLEQTAAPKSTVRYRRGPLTWLAVAGMLLYPALKVGAFRVDGSAAAAAVTSAIAYFLAMFLYFSIADMAYNRRTVLLWLAGLGGAVLAAALGGLDDVWLVLTSWSMVWLVAVVAGRLILAQRTRTMVYVSGVLLLVIISAIEMLPRWAMLMQFMTGMSSIVQSDIQNSLLAGGYTPEMVQSYGEVIKKLLDWLVRLTPASMVMTVITQFSVGYLLFLNRIHRCGKATRGVDNFVLWKVPFALTPVLILAILARLAGNETVRMLADNAIVVMAIFYCISGLAVIEHFLRRFGVSRLLRVLFYLLLFFTQVAGLAAAVLLGFIDSFTDWRKLSGANTSIET
ncbi:MAG: DUF2232 domain-containing protein [Candidatus Zixiibacteriota bacterium]